MRSLSAIVLPVILLTGGPLCPAGNHSSKEPWSSNSSPTSSSPASSLVAGSSPQNCLSVAEVRQQVGKANCVTGTVVRVERSGHGVTFLDFCPEYRSCPFTVVVFPSDLRKLGDVRQLQGRVITIQGKIEKYDQRAEIVLRHAQQLGDSAALLTPLQRTTMSSAKATTALGASGPAKKRSPSTPSKANRFRWKIPRNRRPELYNDEKNASSRLA